MRVNIKPFLIIFFLILSAGLFSQVNSLEISAEREKKFTPYMYARHGGPEGVAEFKKSHKHEYLKELWYYSASFYVKHNYMATGVSLDESIIDISRFETSRKENEEAIVVLPGFKDVLVLLPAKNLIYSPEK